MDKAPKTATKVSPMTRQCHFLSTVHAVKGMNGGKNSLHLSGKYNKTKHIQIMNKSNETKA